MRYFDRNFIDDRLEEAYAKLDDAQELEVWRQASEMRLCLELHQKAGARPYEDVYAVHLLEPRTGRCLLVRHSWRQIANALRNAKPITVRRWMEQAQPCPQHPAPPAEAAALGSSDAP
jgi:hypothetical protein